MRLFQLPLVTVKSSLSPASIVLEAVTGEAPHDVVFVHGAGGNNLLWKRTLQFLAGKRKALAVNLPGHPSGEITCRSISEYSDALDDFIKESRLTRPVVCGHSMGSAIALMLAIDHPQDLGGLVLLSAGAKLGVDPVIVEGLRNQPMKAIEQTITPMSYYKIDLGLGREARAALSFNNIPIFLNDYLACNGFDMRDKLAGIATKTLIICGENDRMTPPKWSHYLNANILSSIVFFIREAGHMVPLEKPEVCSKLIESFLFELSR